MAKRRTKKPVQGLGDVIANITNSVGIAPCEDCKERQFKLNRLFNFKRPKSEMSEADKEMFAEFMELKGLRVIEGKRTVLSIDDINYLNMLYLNYFRLDNSNCPTCSKVHDEIKAKRYARACEIRADVIFEDIIDIADHTAEDHTPFTGANVVQRDKLKIDARKWIVAKLHPKKYADRSISDVTVHQEQPLFPDVSTNDSNK
jgi:hypothetical protein